MKINRIMLLVLACRALCPAASTSAVFNFDQENIGTTTNFTETVNGISSTFSSTADPGGFVVYSSMFETLTGNVLGDPGPAGVDGLDLSINFNKDLSAVTLNFATADFNSASPLTLTAYENSSLVGSATSTGQFLSGFTFPEGEVTFSSGTFNQLVISSTAMDFAVDNISVSATPEPAAISLFGVGLFALGIPAVRRMFAPAAKQ